eukprot:3607706-Rhodomonas_salina.1
MHLGSNLYRAQSTTAQPIFLYEIRPALLSEGWSKKIIVCLTKSIRKITFLAQTVRGGSFRKIDPALAVKPQKPKHPLCAPPDHRHLLTPSTRDPVLTVAVLKLNSELLRSVLIHTYQPADRAGEGHPGLSRYR